MAAVTAREVEKLVREVKEAIAVAVAGAAGTTRDATGALLAASSDVSKSIAGAEARVSETLVMASERMNAALVKATQGVLGDVAGATTRLVTALAQGGAEAARTQAQLPRRDARAPRGIDDSDGGRHASRRGGADRGHRSPRRIAGRDE